MSKLTLGVLDRKNKNELDETRKVLLSSYQQFETLLDSKKDFEEYIEKIKVSLYNEGIDQVFIAKLDNKIVGTLQLYLNSVDAYHIEDFNVELPFIRLLAVTPEARNKGVARKLIDVTIAYLKGNGYQEVYLHTSDIMDAAIQLYESYGFERYREFDFRRENRNAKCYRYNIEF